MSSFAPRRLASCVIVGWVAVWLGAVPVQAQAAPPPSAAPAPALHVRGAIGLFGLLAMPFHQRDGADALGFGLGFGVGIGAIPVRLGIDFMMAYAGTSSSQSDVGVDGQAWLADTRRQDQSLFFDVSARIQPPYWPVQPYVEGVVGTRLLRTRYALSFPGATDVTTLTIDRDWTSSLGWGAGVDLYGLLSKNGAVSLTLGLRRLSGSQAAFAREMQVNGKAAAVHYDVPTDTTIFMLGFGGRFDLAGARSTVSAP